MGNEEQRRFAGAVPALESGEGAWRDTRSVQCVRGVAGRLRPYRDVRAGFEPWRRVALGLWAARDGAATVH